MLASLLLGWLVGCGMPLAENSNAGSGSRGADIDTVPSGDGVPIAYRLVGRGEPAVILVHGWACDQSFWSAQVAPLAMDHAVVTLDLAGHGESGAGRQRWSVNSMGEDIRAVVEHLGLRRVVLVGHSMGGPAVLEAARLLPDRTLGVIGVDTFRDAESHADSEQWQTLIESFRQDFEVTCGQFVDALFRQDAEPALVASVEKRMCDVDPDVGLALLQALSHYRLDAAMGFVAAPIRAINSDLFPTQTEINRRYAPEFEVEVMHGIGHFPMLERPRDFGELLLHAVEDLAARWVDLGAG